MSSELHPDSRLRDQQQPGCNDSNNASILDLIAAQHAEGLTVAMVTHDASVAARAQRVVHLRDGQVVEG